MVKNRQPVLLRETDFAERAHQLSQVRRAEHRLRPRAQRPQIQHRLINAPFPAYADQFRQAGLAGCQVEMTLARRSG